MAMASDAHTSTLPTPAPTLTPAPAPAPVPTTAPTHAPSAALAPGPYPGYLHHSLWWRYWETPAPAPAPVPTTAPTQAAPMQPPEAPHEAPGPPVVCACGRPAQMQWDRRYQLCCEPCAFNDGHSPQCDARFGVGIEPEPDGTPIPTQAPNDTAPPMPAYGLDTTDTPAPVSDLVVAISSGRGAAVTVCSIPGCDRPSRFWRIDRETLDGVKICCVDCTAAACASASLFETSGHSLACNATMTTSWCRQWRRQQGNQGPAPAPAPVPNLPTPASAPAPV